MPPGSRKLIKEMPEGTKLAPTYWADVGKLQGTTENANLNIYPSQNRSSYQIDDEIVYTPEPIVHYDAAEYLEMGLLMFLLI